MCRIEDSEPRLVTSNLPSRSVFQGYKKGIRIGWRTSTLLKKGDQTGTTVAAKNITLEVENRLALAKRKDKGRGKKKVKTIGKEEGNSVVKVETIGKEEGNNEVANRLLDVMQHSRSKRYDPNTSMIMYQYSNDKGANLKKQYIPSFALNFLHEAAINGLDHDIKELTHLEGKKRAYKYSFLNCIAERLDYSLLYPRPLKKLEGASPTLFLLYQTYIMKYSNRSLCTAYKIAEYLKRKVDTDKLAINIERSIKKQNTVKKWIINMAAERAITLDEYYDLFIRSPLDRRNPWKLVKYYMLTNKTTEFKNVVDEDIIFYNQEYKDRVTKVGTMIFDAYLADKGRNRLVKLLGRFASGDIHRNWLIQSCVHLSRHTLSFLQPQLPTQSLAS
jgi:hypothetical protein